MVKILIGCVTYDGQKPFLNELLKSIHELEIEKDALFVDNSQTDDYFNLLKEKNLNVIKDSGKGRIERIISGRNIIREYFLSGDWDYLFFLDTDVIAPKNTVQELLKCGADIATGIYLGNQEIGTKLMISPVIYKLHGIDTVQAATIKDVLAERIFEIAICGLGCCLIKRDVLEKIKFRQFSEKNEVQDDVAFCVDSRKAGFKIMANTAVKCRHIIKISGKYAALEIKES